jgi:hypothetical protein
MARANKPAPGPAPEVQAAHITGKWQFRIALITAFVGPIITGLVVYFFTRPNPPQKVVQETAQKRDSQRLTPQDSLRTIEPDRNREEASKDKSDKSFPKTKAIPTPKRTVPDNGKGNSFDHSGPDNRKGNFFDGQNNGTVEQKYYDAPPPPTVRVLGGVKENVWQKVYYDAPSWDSLYCTSLDFEYKSGILRDKMELGGIMPAAGRTLLHANEGGTTILYCSHCISRPVNGSYKVDICTKVPVKQAFAKIYVLVDTIKFFFEYTKDGVILK